jgi:hypothetical protein
VREEKGNGVLLAPADAGSIPVRASSRGRRPTQ